MKRFIIKGNICYSKTKSELCIVENGYVICSNGISKGVYEELPNPPEYYSEYDFLDYSGQIIIPGLVDLHVHAPQYNFRGIGMDLELIDWLNTHTFKEEEKFKDLTYADESYDIFVKDMKNSATTRACIFGTIHSEATVLLMKKLEEAGISAFVGKVNMDRNSPEYLSEQSAQESIESTEEWLKQVEQFENVKPILTPRFTPSCTDALMERLSEVQKKYHLPIQSHLSENLSEIEWVKELCPGTTCYGDSYDRYDLFGKECPTIMAHCVYSGEKEIGMMKEQGVYVAHCPESNVNLSSGVASVRRYLDNDVKVGLGSDVAAGSSLSILKAMAMAIQCSKLRWRLLDNTLSAITIDEAFYMGTKGGGEFFGKVGSFEKGYEFDAVVLNDASLETKKVLSLRERVERIIYCADDRMISAKYVKGKQIL